MVRIVDRRLDGRNKSSLNRSRFIRRFKGQIRQAVAEAIARRGIRDLDRGERVGIPAGDISEPQFRLGQGGVREVVHPGNDRFHAGDQVDRPLEGGPGGGRAGAGADGHGVDEFVFTLSRDEFLDIFFDELALPNLVKRQLARIDDYRRVRAGYTQSGVPTNINLVRTMRSAAGRRLAAEGSHRARLRELAQELAQAEAGIPVDLAAVDRLRREIEQIQARRAAIPFIDPFDVRYSNHIHVPRPSTRAVMFCLMDVSGSMDEERKQIAKRFFMLLYLFLRRTYEQIEVVFIRHHTLAEEVDEQAFFHSRETGGTIVSSALKLMAAIIGERYDERLWNIYGAQASDGDNWNDDSPLCGTLLAGRILPRVQHFAYIEIADSEPQNLWRVYQEVAARHPGRFALQRIAESDEIYPVFRELFRRRLA